MPHSQTQIQDAQLELAKNSLHTNPTHPNQPEVFKTFAGGSMILRFPESQETPSHL